MTHPLGVLVSSDKQAFTKGFTFSIFKGLGLGGGGNLSLHICIGTWCVFMCGGGGEELA